jgi:hypothetical protein
MIKQNFLIRIQHQEEFKLISSKFLNFEQMREGNCLLDL